MPVEDESGGEEEEEEDEDVEEPCLPQKIEDDEEAAAEERSTRRLREAEQRIPPPFWRSVALPESRGSDILSEDQQNQSCADGEDHWGPEVAAEITPESAELVTAQESVIKSPDDSACNGSNNVSVVEPVAARKSVIVSPTVSTSVLTDAAKDQDVESITPGSVGAGPNHLKRTRITRNLQGGTVSVEQSSPGP
ncbi:hypothetical protein NDU88_009825 [Pleurodeles waltl]|uniref:Uncharacterized protein n=1 Tax=Pleurodeles waltl TaxID=8319 RepID=A0AAV7PUA4_PLEWA|nr:hypothetical protein NDU88_009825 [Pleurodeles waltl]